MITKTFYEYIILLNLQDCLDDVDQLRAELKADYGFQVGSTDKKEISDFLGKHIQTLVTESKQIIGRYQKHNLKNKRFLESFIWFVLTDIKAYKYSNQIKIKTLVNQKTGEKEVWVKVNKDTKKTDLDKAWESIIKPAIDKLPEEYSVKNQKNRQQTFEARLNIYKLYLRAKKQWENKDIYNALYKSKATDLWLNKIETKKVKGLDAMRKAIQRFEKEFPHLVVISESELLKPLAQSGHFSS